MKLSARERRLLGFLAVLALAGGLRGVWSLARPAQPAANAAPAAEVGARGGRARRAGAAAIPDEVVALRSDRLEPSAPAELVIGRDPFRFAPVVPPPPPPPTAEELERRRLEQEERERLAALRREQELVPRPPEVTLRYLGSFGPRGRRIAVFADAAGQAIYNAFEGDTLEGKFVVDHIGFESVDLKFVGFPDAPARRLGIAP